MVTTIKQLKEQIRKTHKHIVRLSAEIAALRKKNTIRARARAKALSVYVRAQEALDARRRKQLAKLERHKLPTPPKPAPKPTPVPPKPDPKPVPPKPKPPQRFTMYDSTNVDNIPSDAEAVAGYINGAFTNFDELVHRFPHAKHLSIDVNASAEAHCLDVETGDAVPADAPGWVRRQHARGLKRPVLYANTSTMPAVIDALTRDGIKRDEYLIWTAHYTNVPHIEPGSDATQWEDHDELYDVSLCEPYFL